MKTLDKFLAECDEIEQEILKEIFESLEADYWIDECKNNFENL